ncbi:3'-5' exonuclease [Paenibacillus polymyxa]|uniref:3'-5' exonuclease n=1 Tax=Paenibacillus polymyxa (strain SC2) TaxID=886882 RepID=E3EKC1_PAEPS|nr:3'-5' exonuclease [Paenibacillus polymyxa]ADO59448.1 3'-5' exonuclease [Paenibacillus polymyxa SC2]WPQ59712.1 3'-5' exonuclease [Paenibacillus polymyxa]
MNYIIVDLEATCWENDRSKRNEIIEIGAVKLDDHLNVVSEFQAFVKPKLYPQLSEFCMQLTSIEQHDVDHAATFETVLEDFQSWMGSNYWLCSWGYYDKKQLKSDCDLHKQPTSWLRNHISIKHQHGAILKEKLENAGASKSEVKRVEHGVGMEKALKILKIPLEGTHHRGIDDARNIAKIFVAIFDDLKFKL